MARARFLDLQMLRDAWHSQLQDQLRVHPAADLDQRRLVHCVFVWSVKYLPKYGFHKALIKVKRYVSFARFRCKMNGQCVRNSAPVAKTNVLRFLLVLRA
jgi:hypothetical protein